MFWCLCSGHLKWHHQWRWTQQFFQSQSWLIWFRKACMRNSCQQGCSWCRSYWTWTCKWRISWVAWKLSHIGMVKALSQLPCGLWLQIVPFMPPSRLWHCSKCSLDLLLFLIDYFDGHPPCSLPLGDCLVFFLVWMRIVFFVHVSISSGWLH